MNTQRHVVSIVSSRGLILAVVALLCLSLATPLVAAPADFPTPAPGTRDERGPALSTLPLSFIANAGQSDPAVRFTVQGAGHRIFFTDQEIIFSAAASDARTPAAVVRLRFPGANPHPVVEGLSPLPGKANFYRGSDPAAWRAHVPTYGAVVYRELYPGVDLVYSGSEGRLKSEFRLAAGANPSTVRMAYSGLTGAHLQADGALALETPLGTLLDEAPVIFQEIDGVRQTIPGRYLFLSSAQEGEYRVGFRVGAYHPTRPLVIDPELTYSSFLGGSGGERARAIAMNESGEAIYITGQTSSTNFPLLNPLDNSLGGQQDAFVTKIITASGTLVVSYSTYLGGGARDEARGIALLYEDATHDVVYLTGRTDSTDFPTQGAADATYGGGPGDAFVTQINADGTLGFSTYLGGGAIDEGNAIAFGLSSEFSGVPKVYVTGRTDSTDFPANALDTTQNGLSDAFVTQILDTGANSCAFGFSTYLGGSGNDVGYGVSEEWPDRVHVTGRTESSNFPVQNALDATYGGNGDAFLTQVLSTTTDVLLGYSTFLGGAGSDTGYAVKVQGYAQLVAHVIGRTDSADFPTLHAFQPALRGGSDAFVTKVVSQTSGVSMAYSTYLGGRGNDEGYAIVRGSGTGEPVYIAGRTGSNDWPTLNAAQVRHGGGTDDAFVTQVVTRSGNLYIGYSTPLGGQGNEGAYGIVHDSYGTWPNYSYMVFLAGWTDSANWPVTADALDNSLGGESDAFVAQLSQFGQSPVVTTSVGPTQGGGMSVGGGGGAGWSIIIPPGAVTQPNTPVYVAPYTPPSVPGGPPWLKYWTGGGSGGLRSADGSPAQSLPITWLRPVTITIEYDPAAFPGVDENDLLLYGQDDDGIWLDAACTTTQHPDCTGYIRNALSDTITVTTLYVGNLGISAEQPEKAILGRVTTSGKAPLPNVHIAPSVGEAYAVDTDATGYFTLSRLISGTYIITPTLNGYTFHPTHYVVTVTTADVTGYDFTATGGALNYTIYLPLVVRP